MTDASCLRAAVHWQGGSSHNPHTTPQHHSMQPALNAPMAEHIPMPVSDADFKKLVAVIRCAVPYTGRRGVDRRGFAWGCTCVAERKEAEAGSLVSPDRQPAPPPAHPLNPTNQHQYPKPPSLYANKA